MVLFFFFYERTVDSIRKFVSLVPLQIKLAWLISFLVSVTMLQSPDLEMSRRIFSFFLFFYKFVISNALSYFFVISLFPFLRVRRLNLSDIFYNSRVYIYLQARSGANVWFEVIVRWIKRSLISYTRCNV